jgi:hypothetical protein
MRKESPIARTVERAGAMRRSVPPSGRCRLIFGALYIGDVDDAVTVRLVATVHGTPDPRELPSFYEQLLG